MAEAMQNDETNNLLSDMFDYFGGGAEKSDYEDIIYLDFLLNNIPYQAIEEDDEEDQEEIMDENDENQEQEQEQILSQRLSQLLSSNKNENEHENEKQKRTHHDSPSAAGSTLKKMKIHKEEKLSDTIPKYLSSTNVSFVKMIEKQPWYEETMKKNINIESLRSIAVLMHKLAVIDLLRQSSMLPQNQQITTAMSPNNEGQASHIVSSDVIRSLNEKYEQYQRELMEIKTPLMKYTDAIEACLKTYIEEQSIHRLRLKYDLKQTLIKCDYQEQLFQLNFHQENPNEQQKQVAKHLYDLRFALEKAKQRVVLLKQRISTNRPPSSYESLDQASLPSLFQSIQDPVMRQRLLDRHQKIIQQTKTDLFAVFIHGAEANMRHCQQEFDREMAQLWQNYRHSASDQRLTQPMMKLIDERFMNLTQRFQSIHQFQIKYFFSEAPAIEPATTTIM